MENSNLFSKEHPYFSVVIPVFNKGPHIQRSISSVLNQSFQSFELIVVNDASTDNSLDEIHKFKDVRIRIFQRKEPGLGGYAARNLGIEEAKGLWVAFLDADDEWYLNHLEKMHELSIKFPDVFLLGCGYLKQKDGIKMEDPFYLKFKLNETMRINTTDYLQYCLSRRQPICSSVACIKKSSPIALNLFPAELDVKRGGDVYSWLKIVCYHKEMVWSRHIGAVYYLDSVNMVTKNAEMSAQLMSKNVRNNFSKNLTKKGKVLLVKYFNMLLKDAFLISIDKNRKKINIIPLLFWRGDALNALKFSLISLIPKSAINVYSKIRGGSEI